LTEAMKTPADLPDDIVVVIDADSKEASIYYGLANNPSEYAPELKPELYGLSSTDYMGAIDIYSPAKGLFYPWYGNCGDAWMVGGSAAQEGFGPLLYDIAIEWATQNGGGLISDRSSVSPDAQDVWSYYERNRDDVTAHQLDDLENTLTPEDEDNCDQKIGRSTVSGMYDTWQDSQLSKRYTKPPTTMQALGKKLVIL